VHVLELPEQAPPQPVKVWLAPGVAVRVTDVPDEYAALQFAPVLPQLIPLGLELTSPLPVTVVVSE